MSTLSRICLVCPSLEHSGPTYNALTLARELERRGIQTLTAALSGGQRESAFEAEGLAFFTARHLGHWLFDRAGRRRLRRFGPEVVHALDVSVLPQAERLARLTGVPLVVTVNRPLCRRDRKHLERAAEAQIIAVSDAVLTEVVQSRVVPRGRVTVIHNGVELSRYTLAEEPEADHLPAPGEPRDHVPVVGTFGSLRRDKGQVTFLEAAAKVLAKEPEVEFLILGRGPELMALKERAAALGIQRRVTFGTGATFASAATDRVAGKLEAVYLRDLDIFVEPSTQEGLGLSVLQAMAWARPVIASGVGGLYSLVEEGVTGLLVPKQSPDALAEAILSLLADPRRAREMGIRGRERIVAEFNIRGVAAEHLRLYERAAGGAQAGEAEA